MTKRLSLFGGPAPQAPQDSAPSPPAEVSDENEEDREEDEDDEGEPADPLALTPPFAVHRLYRDGTNPTALHLDPHPVVGAFASFDDALRCAVGLALAVHESPSPDADDSAAWVLRDVDGLWGPEVFTEAVVATCAVRDEQWDAAFLAGALAVGAPLDRVAEPADLRTAVQRLVAMQQAAEMRMRDTRGPRIAALLERRCDEAVALLREWLATPFFESRADWERWAGTFRSKVLAVVGDSPTPVAPASEGAHGC
jgi:hypothetical protein